MSDHPPRGRNTLALWNEYSGAQFRGLRIWRLCDALELGTETLKSEIAALKAEAIELREVMVAAAEEIAEYWVEHCDAEGYGPVNLERRLREGLAVSYPGYSIGAFGSLVRECTALKAELARKDELIDDLRAMHNVPSDADLARARDEEARECQSIARCYYSCEGIAQKIDDAIERRISERAK